MKYDLCILACLQRSPCAKENKHFHYGHTQAAAFCLQVVCACWHINLSVSGPLEFCPVIQLLLRPYMILCMRTLTALHNVQSANCSATLPLLKHTKFYNAL